MGVARDCAYLLPQLAVIYYAGQYGIKVITDSEDPIGIPVTARLPELFQTKFAVYLFRTVYSLE